MVRVWVSTALAVALLCAGAAVAALLAWPQGAIGASPRGLAAVSLPGFAGSVSSVRVTDSSGRQVPVSFRHGTLWPRGRVAGGEELTVTVRISRPGWIGWLVGDRSERVRTVVTPVAHLRASLLRPSRGERVSVSFDAPVSRVAIGGSHGHSLGDGSKVVPLGVVASGATSAGTTTVAVAARPWEKLSQPLRVSWFVDGPRVRVVAAPAAGGTVSPLAPLTLTFSQPVSSVLGSSLPRLEPATAGSWSQVDSHTLAFQPTGYGFPLGGTIQVHLPQGSLGGRADPVLSWHVAAGSTLRLQEILGRLGYLPVRWREPSGQPTTPAQELAAAVSAPHGVFSWRFANTPAPLQGLWKEGAWNVVTRGAVMRFEDTHDLATDGVAGPKVWRELLQDDLADRHLGGGYTYVFVHETVPESLNLWHDGKVILTSPGNTGIASAPTAPGTWPVFEHIPSGTMSGTNPDGTHYNDPGVRWISYFHGGDALHAFPRASYGTPQSLGCVELPEDAAAQVWPYTPIGTLVTIEP